MNIQKQTVSQLFQVIITVQEELQAIRQLLNEEITFTFDSTYQSIAADFKTLNLFSIKKFAISPENRDVGSEQMGIERMIKFYSSGKLQLGINEWKTMLLSREDRLLAKLANERLLNDQQPPQYLMSYCKKVILKEACLHAEIAKMQLGQLNQQIYRKAIKDYNEDQVYILMRYLKQGSTGSNQFSSEMVKRIISHSNTTKTADFLQKKQQQFKQKQNRKCINDDPLVHRQLKKLAEKQESAKLLFRQAKSIQHHIGRNNTHSSSRMIEKIAAYTAHLQKQLLIFFKSLRKIMKINQKIVSAKFQLLMNNQVNFSLIFKQISRNSQIIASQLQHYLRTLKFDVPLQSLFVFFKRYCNPISGKLSNKQFNAIFKLPNKPKFQKGLTITPTFRKNIALCILNQIDLETKIQQQKRKLIQQVDLRQIFESMDFENHRKISQTDLKVSCKKIEGKKLLDDQLRQLWWRMKAHSGEFIDYDTFMYELIPRTKCKPNH